MPTIPERLREASGYIGPESYDALRALLIEAAVMLEIQAPQHRERKPLKDASLYLRDLVEAIDGAFISSWQSTGAWQKELDSAREFLADRSIKE